LGQDKVYLTVTRNPSGTSDVHYTNLCKNNLMSNNELKKRGGGRMKTVLRSRRVLKRNIE